MAFRWPQPNTEQAFEELCLDVLKVEWQCATLELYARRGEKQYGIDIIDPAGGTPFRVAQCKLREPQKNLTKAEVLEEVDKVKLFPGGKVDHYLILTTASRSSVTQNAAIEINRAHAAAGLFSVEVRGWDWIESILEADPSLMERTHPLIVGAARKLVNEEFAVERAALTQLTSQLLARLEAKPEQAIDEHDANIDEARRLLDSGDAQVARVLLQRLRDRAWKELSQHQKFRIVTNLGVSYMATDDRERVAELLIEGASYEPDTEKSGVNRAIALEIRGETDEAYAAAEAVSRKFPSSAAALAARIRNAPAAKTWEELTGWVTADLGADATVGMALAMRALELGRPDDALHWAARAVAEADDSLKAQSLVVQGRATIQAALRRAWLGDGEFSEDDRNRLRDAIRLLSIAIESLVKRIPTLAGEAYAHRSHAYDFLGDQAAAARDVEEAARLAHDNPFVRLRAGERHLAAKEWNRAASHARRAIELHVGPVASHLLARALWSRNESGDRVEAAEILVTLARTEGLIRPSAAVHEATAALCGVGRAHDAWALVDEVSEALGSAVHTCRASVAVMTGDIDRAKTELEHALATGWESLERADQRHLAATLIELRRDSNALPILTALHRPGRLDGDAGRLLNCALRLGQHELVMQVLASLREAGVRDPWALRTELSLLKRYVPSRALEVLQSLVIDDPSNREARLELSVVALRLGRSALISTAPADLPLAEEATLEAARFVVELLQHTGEGRRAIEYAYTVLRRHFRDPEAHRRFIFAVLWSDALPAERKRVEPRTAVRFRDETTQRERWLVVEPVHANPERQEEGPDGPLACKLLGQQVGDKVLVVSGAVQDRFVTILEIVENVTFRFRDSLNEWQVRFPHEQGFEMIQLARPGAPSDSDDLDFEPVLRMAHERHASIEKLDATYLSTSMPIFMLSEGQNMTEVETWNRVLQTEALPIRCCSGTQEEWGEAAEVVESCRAVVLDIGAVLAVDWLELRDILAAWPIQRLLTHATVQALRAQKTELERRAGKAHDPNRDAAVVHLEQFLRFLLDTCQPIDTPELATLPAETRDNLLKYLGSSSAESIAAATHPGRVLWSDQVVVGLLGRKALGVTHVWTQAIVHGRHAVGAMSDERRASIDARLLALRYVTTRYGERAIVAGAIAAGWDTNRFPFKQNLEEVVGAGGPVHDRVWVIIRTIVAMCTEAATPEVRSIAVIALLERIALRPAGFAAIRAVRRALRFAFGVNHLRADEADQVIVGWLAAHGALDE